MTPEALDLTGHSDISYRCWKIGDIARLMYNRDGKMSVEVPEGLHYPDELRLKEVLSLGIPMLIPRGHLYGRQLSNNYDNSKRRSVEANLRKEGIQFLFKDPIIVCALPAQEGLKMVIIDGHHRTRYSGGFNIGKIPSIVYTPDQLISAFAIRFNATLTAEALIDQLDGESGNALASFTTLPAEKLPSIVGNAKTIEDLPFERLHPLAA